MICQNKERTQTHKFFLSFKKLPYFSDFFVFVKLTHTNSHIHLAAVVVFDVSDDGLKRASRGRVQLLDAARGGSLPIQVLQRALRI